MKTIMFTGHRDRTVSSVDLNNILSKYKDSVWIHGGASGFDSQIETLAKQNSIQTRIYKPDYKKYYSKRAPLERNKIMVNDCDAVVACFDGRKSGGTFFAINEATKQNKPVIVIRPLCHISK